MVLENHCKVNGLCHWTIRRVSPQRSRGNTCQIWTINSQQSILTVLKYSKHKCVNCWRQITLIPHSSGLFNSLWPIDDIGHHRTWSSLVQVMTCCLTTPSHYMNQGWLIISEVSWQSIKSDLTSNMLKISIRDRSLIYKDIVLPV